MNFEDFANDDRSWIGYGEEELRLWLKRCPKCMRFVKADKSCFINNKLKPNATCKIHGRVRMSEM